MIEVARDLWDWYCNEENVMVCITTNGFVKKNGEAVCGRGCALEATKFFPGFSRILGERIQKYGNVAGIMQVTPDEEGVYIFPVKHNWWEPASTNLILASAHCLFEQAKRASDIRFILPRPGCGNGKLQWEGTEGVKALIEFLPDNVLVVHRDPSK